MAAFHLSFIVSLVLSVQQVGAIPFSLSTPYVTRNTIRNTSINKSLHSLASFPLINNAITSSSISDSLFMNVYSNKEMQFNYNW